MLDQSEIFAFVLIFRWVEQDGTMKNQFTWEMVSRLFGSFNTRCSRVESYV